MIRWKRAVGIAAVFVLMSVLAVAGEVPRESGARAAGRERGQRGQPGAELGAKVFKLLEPTIIKQLVSELSITEAKAKEVLAAYREASEKVRAAMEKIRQSEDPEKRRGALQQMRQINQQSLEGKLDGEKARTALRILATGGQLQMSLAIFLRANVEESKIEKAVPVLAKFQSDVAGLRRGGNLSREEQTAKFNELCDKTAKELASIVGEEPAAAWKERAARLFGARAGEGDRPADRPSRRGGAEGAAPVAP